MTEANRCEQLAQDCYAAFAWVDYESTTCWSQVERSTRCATAPLYTQCIRLILQLYVQQLRGGSDLEKVVATVGAVDERLVGIKRRLTTIAATTSRLFAETTCRARSQVQLNVPLCTDPRSQSSRTSTHSVMTDTRTSGQRILTRGRIAGGRIYLRQEKFNATPVRRVPPFRCHSYWFFFLLPETPE